MMPPSSTVAAIMSPHLAAICDDCGDQDLRTDMYPVRRGRRKVHVCDRCYWGPDGYDGGGA